MNLAFLLSTCPFSLLLTWPHHLSLYAVIFFLTGATFTDPLTWSFLMLSFFVIPNIYISILISFTFNLFSWLFVIDHVSAPYTNAGLTTVLYIFLFSFVGIFSSYNCTSSNFPMLHNLEPHNWKVSLMTWLCVFCLLAIFPLIGFSRSHQFDSATSLVTKLNCRLIVKIIITYYIPDSQSSMPVTDHYDMI